MISVETVELEIQRLDDLRTAQTIAENPEIAMMVLNATQPASDLLNELRDLMRREITLDLIFEKVVNADD